MTFFGQKYKSTFSSERVLSIAEVELEGEVDEDVIVAGLKARNKAAIEQFWRYYYDRVYPICAFVLGRGPDATDMTVDILVDFIEKYVDNLSKPKALFVFLRQMAVRRSLRMRERRNKATPFESDDHECKEATPEEKAGLNLLMPYLNHCLGQVTPKTQAALRLKYTKKISNEEIGAIIGGSKSYIGRLLQNGREALRKCIEKSVKDKNLEPLSSLGWANADGPFISLSTVEKLMAARPKREFELCGELDSMVDALLDVDFERKRKWAGEHLGQCAECKEALLLLQAMEGIPVAHAPRISKWDRGPKEFPVSFKAAAIAAAAAVTLILSVAVLTPDKGREEIPPGQGLTVKGAVTDSFFVAAKRGATSFTVRPLDRLVTGDKLGLFYSSHKKGYLAIFSRDAEGEVALLYPVQGEVSAPISAGHKTPLKDGAIVGDGRGCEWLIAVFSESPLKLGKIARELKKADGGERKGACELDASVPNARSLLVLPVLR